MKLLIDSVDVAGIKRIDDLYPIDGVTCNPSILAKEKRNPYEVLNEIREIIKDRELHVQVINTDADKIVEEGKFIAKKLGKKTFIKIPVTPQGLKAIKILSNEGYNVTATAIYMPMQGWLAAKAGAKCLAPYVNRIDNMGYDGVKVAKEIHDLCIKNNLDSGLLAASFKNSQQVLDLALYGVKAVTCSIDVIDNFLKNVAVTSAVEAFTKDFYDLCGDNSDMISIGK
ncbi:MAG: transaldolase family protein [Erysipelotrichaceae bacterium]